MVVGGKQRARAESGTVVDIFRNGPGDAKPIIGAGATSNFIQQD